MAKTTATNKTGASTGTIVLSPRARRKRDRLRRAEERAWAARCGPVKIIRPDQPPAA